MGANKQEIRQQQLSVIETRIAARKAELSGRSIEGLAQEKDPVLQHLVAEARRIRKALQAIQKCASIIKAAREKSQEKAAAAAEEPKQKKKKQTESAPAEANEKKDKKAKKAAKAAEKTQATTG